VPSAGGSVGSDALKRPAPLDPLPVYDDDPFETGQPARFGLEEDRLDVQQRFSYRHDGDVSLDDPRAPVAPQRELGCDVGVALYPSCYLSQTVDRRAGQHAVVDETPEVFGVGVHQEERRHIAAAARGERLQRNI
jgi:hypothetical protein